MFQIATKAEALNCPLVCVRVCKGLLFGEARTAQ